uniref:Uncharacterized protein n=1 Tax=Meleagris gallopavo TaxID=9103 RepID=A0A803YAK3_MELGA
GDRAIRSDGRWCGLISRLFLAALVPHRSLCRGEEHAGSGFILVHLNIHDSLHFCSKRHLFI